MAKYSLNLIIRKQNEPEMIRKLKIILPVTAGASLVIFLAIFLMMFIYINKNVNQFNLLKRQTQQMENKISSQKMTEGDYTVAASRINVLGEILDKEKKFIPLISELDRLNTGGIKVEAVSSDRTGNISLSLIASSSASLDDFVTTLLYKEDQKLFSDIKAQGISREKNGNYHMTLSLKADKNLLP